MKNLIFLLVIVMTAFACKSDKRYKTPNGFEYSYLKKGNGPAVDTGMYAYFTFDIKAGDTLSLIPRDPSMVEKALISPIDEQNKRSPILEGLRVMKVGDSICVYIPMDSIPQATPEMKKYAEVQNFIALHDLKTKEEFLAEQAEIDTTRSRISRDAVGRRDEVASGLKDILNRYKSGDLADVLKSGDGGVEYYITEPGDGPAVEPLELISVQYYGVLESNGERFDDSFVEGQPYTYTVDAREVIPGWDDAIKHMHKGDKAVLFIPADRGYGERGSPPAIPANAPLVFYVELLPDVF